MLLLLLLLACSGGPRGGEDLDAESLHGRFYDVYREDPARVTEWLLAMEDDTARSVLLFELSIHDPSAARHVCGMLEARSVTNQRCTRLLNRPHLGEWGRSSEARLRETQARTAPGPRNQFLPAPSGLKAVGNGVRVESPVPADCRARCAQLAAMGLAREGRIDEVIAVCDVSRLGSGMEAADCRFKAAEAVAALPDAAGLEPGLRLCAANSLEYFCVPHVIEMAAPQAVAADRAGWLSLRPARRYAARLQAVAADDEGLGELYTSLFWAAWLDPAFAIAKEVTGDLLDALPPEVAPQVRYAAALRLLGERSFADVPAPATVVADLQAALERRGTWPGFDPPRTDVVISNAPFSWLSDTPSDDALPTTFIGGGDRRVFDPDPDVDLRLAVLEAAARLPTPPPASWFLAWVGTAEPEIARWVAVRIAARMDPGAVADFAGAMPASEQSARIRQRVITARFTPQVPIPRDPPLPPSSGPGE